MTRTPEATSRAAMANRRRSAVAALLVAMLGAGEVRAEGGAWPAEKAGDRTLRCTLGRATNLDPSKSQTIADIAFEGSHPFSLVLPAANIRPGPAPDPSDPPEPVDPATRIIEDPDGLMREARPDFYRVVDRWPERVEMISLVNPPVADLIIVSEIRPDSGRAWLYLARISDAASVDLNRVYQGPCTLG